MLTIVFVVGTAAYFITTLCQRTSTHPGPGDNPARIGPMEWTLHCLDETRTDVGVRSTSYLDFAECLASSELYKQRNYVTWICNSTGRARVCNDRNVYPSKKFIIY